MKEEDCAWQWLSHCTLWVPCVSKPLPLPNPSFLSRAGAFVPSGTNVRLSLLRLITWDWSEAAFALAPSLKPGRARDRTCCSFINSIRALQQQKANYCSPSGSLSLWARLREDLEGRTCPSRGNLDSVTKAVTQSDLSLCGSSVPFVWAGLTGWKMMIYPHFSRKIPSSHQSFITL